MWKKIKYFLWKIFQKDHEKQGENLSNEIIQEAK